MQRHEIPTHLAVEDKLLGPLTTRDALTVLVGASAAYGLWTNAAVPPGVRSALAGGVTALTLAFALLKIRGRPLAGWLLAGLVYAGSPKRSTWAPRLRPVTRSRVGPGTRARPYRPRVRWRVPRARSGP